MVISKTNLVLDFLDKKNATDRLDDNWSDIIDMKLKLKKSTRAQIVTWGPEALTCMISRNIEGFFKAWYSLLHSLIFFNPWILRRFSNYGPIKSDKAYLKPESFSLSNNDCRHRKIKDMLDEQGFNPLSVQRDDPGFAKLN